MSTVNGVCHHDCPDSCGWTVTVEDGVADQAARQPRPSLQLRRAVPEGQPLPRPRLLPGPRSCTRCAASGAKGSGQFEQISWDAGAGRDRRRDSTRSSPSTAARRSCRSATPATRACSRRKASPDRFFNHIGATQLLRNICGPTVGAGVKMTNGTSLVRRSARSRALEADPPLGNQHPPHEPSPVAGDRARSRRRRAARRDRPDPHDDRRRSRPVRPAATRHRRGDDAGDDARHHRRRADRRRLDRRAHARVRRARRARRRLDARARRGGMRCRRRRDPRRSPASTPPPAPPRSAR